MRSGSRRRTTRILAIVITLLVVVIVVALAVVLFRGLKKHKSAKKTAEVADMVETEPEAVTGSVVTTVEPADNVPVSEPTQIPEEVPAEPEEEPEKTVTVTGDNVRMRAEPNTDCEVVRTCKKGETYVMAGVEGDWTKVINDGRECYIKSEFVEEVKQEPEQEQGSDNPEAEKPQGGQAVSEVGGEAEAPDPGKKPDEGKKIGEDMVEVECKDGKEMFTKAEYDYFVATWSYTGMADKMMTHHTAEELHTLYKNTH